MDALVNSQSGPLDELLAAAGVVADVRSDASVDALCVTVSLQLLIKRKQPGGGGTNHDGPDRYA